MGLSELLGLCIRAEDYKLKSPLGTSRVRKCWGWSAGVSSKQGNPDLSQGPGFNFLPAKWYRREPEFFRDTEQGDFNGNFLKLKHY